MSSSNGNWLFIGYVAAFFSVYAAALFMSIIPNMTNQAGWTAVEWQTTAGWNYHANATMTTASTASWIPIITVIIGVFAVIGILVSSFAFGQAG